MGLDITVHIGMRPAHPEEQAIIESDEDKQAAAYTLGLHMIVHGIFARRCEDLPSVAGSTRSWGFCAGAYSSYNRWREGLAGLVGIETTPYYGDQEPGAVLGRDLNEYWSKCEEMEKLGVEPTEPFWQLIHFSDCHGSLGPAVCAKLAGDFDAHAEKAATHRDALWREKYATWRKAFRDVADHGGWISFH